MARTRAQEKAGAPEKSAASAKQDTKKRPYSKTQETATSKKQLSKRAKTDTKSETSVKPETDQQQKKKEKKETPQKSFAKEKQPPPPLTRQNPKIQTLISRYGSLPLSNTTLEDPSSPTAETILALLFNAMLSSARISHELAAKTVSTVVKAKWHHLDVLKKTSWQERTEVLTEGGYTRYREKTATGFGELVEFIESKHDSDLNNILKAAGESPPKIREKLKEIKGLGDVGVDIFIDTAQGLWTCLAPFIDSRSQKTVDAIGIGGENGEAAAKYLWKEVGEDPVQMCKLASALTRVRLEKREGEFKK